MVKEFVLNKKDIKEKLVKDSFKSCWFVVVIAALFILAAIVALDYSILAGFNILIYISIACLVVGVAFLGFWVLGIINSYNKMLKLIFGEEETKSLKVDILEDKLFVTEANSEQEPSEYSYLAITKLKHTNDYSILLFGKKVWLIIPNNILFTEEVEFFTNKYKANKSKKLG